MLRVWNLSLLCATFALTILGTFLTRSGVLDSVHAFSDSSIGPLLLGFFAVIVARHRRARSAGAATGCGRPAASTRRCRARARSSPTTCCSPRSRSSCCSARCSRWSSRRSTTSASRSGAPYFDRMTMPIGLALLFLMAIAPVLPWRKASASCCRSGCSGRRGSARRALVRRRRARRPRASRRCSRSGSAASPPGPPSARSCSPPAARAGAGFVGRTNGGMIVHLGVVVIAVALAASGGYVHQQEVAARRGRRPARSAGHEITYLGTQTEDRAEKTVTKALVRIDGGQVYAPALSLFPFSGQTIGTPSVRTTLTGRRVLSVAATAPRTTATRSLLRVIVQPLVVWLWIGGGIVAFGTVLAAFPGRRRRPTAPGVRATGRRPASIPILTPTPSWCHA